MTTALLKKEMYSESEAARLLGLPQSTLHWWLEGGVRRGKGYPPVIRSEATGDRSVTWAEFIEAGLLSQYRRVHKVPLRELRTLIDFLRNEMRVEYPLADYRPFVGEGRRLLLSAQEKATLGAEFCLVAFANKQLVLTPPSEAFFSRVEWIDEVATSWRPHSDPGSPVRMNPDVRFGLPSIRGIKTQVIWEHVEADESFDDVAEQFNLSPTEVRWAYSYEVSARAA